MVENERNLCRFPYRDNSCDFDRESLNQRSAIENNPIFKGKFKRFRAGNRYILKANWSTHQKYKVSNSFFSLLDAFILYKVNFLSRFHPVIEIIILTIISTFQPWNSPWQYDKVWRSSSAEILGEILTGFPVEVNERLSGISELTVHPLVLSPEPRPLGTTRLLAWALSEFDPLLKLIIRTWALLQAEKQAVKYYLYAF